MKNLRVFYAHLRQKNYSHSVKTDDLLQEKSRHLVILISLDKKTFLPTCGVFNDQNQRHDRTQRVAILGSTGSIGYTNFRGDFANILLEFSKSKYSSASKPMQIYLIKRLWFIPNCCSHRQWSTLQKVKKPLFQKTSKFFAGAKGQCSSGGDGEHPMCCWPALLGSACSNHSCYK